MNKIKYKFIQKLLLIAVVFLAGCNQTYYKINDSPPLKEIEINYKNIYESDIGGYSQLDFVRNDAAISIASLQGIKIIELNNKKIVKTIDVLDYGFESASSNEDGSRYALLMNGLVKVLDTQNWTLINQLGMGRSVGDVILSNNGKFLYLEDALWNVDTGEKIVDDIGAMSPSGYEFSEDSRYFIQTEIRDRPGIVDIKSAKMIEVPSFVRGTNQTSFKDNKSYYIDYGVIGSAYAETLVLLTVDPAVQLAEITPYSRISCWTQLEEDTRLVMGLEDGDVLVLDEKLNVLYHWSLGSTVLKCEGGKNGKAWLATESAGLFELNIDKRTLANSVKLKGRIKELVVSSDEKYIALVDDIPGRETVAKIYLRDF